MNWRELLYWIIVALTALAGASWVAFAIFTTIHFVVKYW